MSTSHLSFRSNYSLLRGCRSPEEICRFAREHGICTVAMADINNFYGLIAFLLAAKREGVQPVVGLVVERNGRDLFTAYVMNRQGYSSLCRILSEMLTDTTDTYDPVAALQQRGWEGLSLLSPHPDIVDRLAQQDNRGLYVHLRFGKPFAFLASFARDRGLPTVATQETVFFNESDEQLYPLLRAIDLNVTIEHVPQEEKRGTGHRFVGADDMGRFFSAVPGGAGQCGGHRPGI